MRLLSKAPFNGQAESGELFFIVGEIINFWERDYHSYKTQCQFAKGTFQATSREWKEEIQWDQCELWAGEGRLSLCTWLSSTWLLYTWVIIQPEGPARWERYLGLLLADGAPTVGWGKTFWQVSRIFLRKQL